MTSSDCDAGTQGIVDAFVSGGMDGSRSGWIGERLAAPREGERAHTRRRRPPPAEYGVRLGWGFMSYILVWIWNDEYVCV